MLKLVKFSCSSFLSAANRSLGKLLVVDQVENTERRSVVVV